MFTKIQTATLNGVEGYPVSVETDLHRGMPGFYIAGLADTTIKEAVMRIKPAILNSDYRFPMEKVTVNLVPAGRPKEGSHFDLPIALGIIMLEGNIVEIEETAFLGEVSLDGKVNPVRGVLPLIISLRKAGIKKVVVPAANAEEASILEDIKIMAVETLREAAEYVLGEREFSAYERKQIELTPEVEPDFAQVIGQESVKRAILIGAAGNHGMLMMGGPGCGKTMMARRIPSILPPLSYEEKLEITGIYSVAGLLNDKNPIVSARPFRSPHHTITMRGLVGGGTRPRPGELSLAHRGVLFLDELGEFDGRVIDSMRQPIEEGVIRITRNSEEMIFPSKVMVVVAANPCKCGNLWDERKVCTCTRKQLDSHRRKLMGPFADRIDMHIKVNPVDKEKLTSMSVGESSKHMRDAVAKVREIQRKRYEGLSYRFNSELDEKGLKEFCKLDENTKEMLMNAYDRLGLTMRAYAKILKLARTIADLDESENIMPMHIAEALQFRLSQ